MTWTFPKFAHILRPYMPENINGKLNQDKCVRTLFSKITSDPEKFAKDVLDSITSLRPYFTGKIGLGSIAPKIISRLNKDNFVLYLTNFSEDAKSEIAKQVKQLDPNQVIYKTTVPTIITKIFVEILLNATGNKNNENKKNNLSNRAIEGEKKFYLPKTVLDQQFDSVFREIDSSKLEICSDNCIHVFALKTGSYPLTYDSLITLLLNNLGRYVFSRLRWEHMCKNGNSETIGLYARRELKKILSNQVLTNNKLLGELLIYIFLEHVEEAPKLLTQVEFDNNNIQSDGIFLKINNNCCQYIVGSTEIYDVISKGIDESLLQIGKLENSTNVSPIKLIDSGYLNMLVDDDTYKQLAKVLIPQDGKSELIRSYGIFIGYSFTNIKKLLAMPKKDADKKFEEQLYKDMKSASKYLSKEISKSGLQQRSFYVFMLPFSRAEKDGNDIIKNILD